MKQMINIITELFNKDISDLSSFDFVQQEVMFDKFVQGNKASFKKYDIKYHRREPYYASSDCTNSEYHEYLAKVTDAENILVTQVTAPLITVDTFIEAIDIYNNVNCNSLMSIKKIKEYLWYKNEPINYKLDYAPNSQDLPDYFAPTFGVIIVNKEAMLKAKNFICSKPNFYELSDTEAIDIDTELDFEFAEFLFKKRNNA